MRIQFRYRTMVLAALAISLLAIAGFPQTVSAGAADANNARQEIAAQKRAEAKGQGGGNDAPSAGTPTAADNPEGETTHDGGNGPGGQICDGDPDGSSDGGTGANGSGEYYDDTCPTTDQTVAAPNGAGDGKATGKPAEGSVGNADDKTPDGQYNSGPSDHNNGYECDEKGRSATEGNNGVGYGNPAHTGCEPSDVDATCVPSATNNQCQPCPAGQSMGANGCQCPAGQTMGANSTCGSTCPDGSAMPASGKCDTCPAGQTMGANGKCECPSGQTMGTDGTCSTPCVPATDNVCSQVTPSCVAAADAARCGGGAVLAESFGRPVEVLGVSIEAPAAVAPAALARTGGFELGSLVQAGVLFALLGLGMTVLGRRRRGVTIDIATRLGG
jgi:hypothetical protein